MYRSHRQQLEFPDFYLPFSGELDPDNRWVKLASLVPWELAEEIYHADLCEDFGAPVVPSRVALGALIIKERLRLTDRETVETIRENPYLQFFIGNPEFTQDRPFDASLMVDFRKRFGEDGMQRIAEAVALKSLGQQVETSDRSAATANDSATDDSKDDPSSTGVGLSEVVDSNEATPNEATPNEATDSVEVASPEPTGDTPDEPQNKAPNESQNKSQHASPAGSPETTQDDAANSPIANRGRLLSDASCAPADIRYPTDVSLLNEAREKTDGLIDKLHQPLVGKQPRPRTYRRNGRKAFLSFIKRKKPGRKKVRAAIRKQLGYLRRNLRAIDRLLANPRSLPLHCLGKVWYKHLLVCREVYRQQQEMYASKTQRIDDRIVSITQPHVRPIKRGKAGRDTEFGAKLTLSVVDGFSFVDRLNWDNYNESLDLPAQIDAYRERFGCYPASVHVDRIYRTRANRALCKSLGIRMSGPPLGRPAKEVSLSDRKQARADEVIRNEVEGKFGESKRRYSLARVMTKLASTSTAQISLTFLVMNLEQALRRLFLLLLWRWSCLLAWRVEPASLVRLGSTEH